jgi:hypothetical protein
VSEPEAAGAAAGAAAGGRTLELLECRPALKKR